MKKIKFFPILSVSACALLLSYPVWRYGLAVNGDAIFHSMWYTHFARQFLTGELYPRWLLDLNNGLGSPAFFYYAPLPYYATLLFTPFFASGQYGLQHLGASVALACAASGLTAYLWLRRVTTETPAAIAAILYLFMPYHTGIDLYTRVAFAELWAFVWMPLVLYFIHLMRDDQRLLALPGLALSYAALIMTHLPTTLIFSLIPPAYALFTTGRGRKMRATMFTIGGMLLGIGLASIYLIPAMTTQEAVSITERDYHKRWLSYRALKPDDLESQLFWTVAAMSGIVACALIISRRTPQEADSLKRERFFWPVVALFSVLMMVPLSNAAWRILTPLQLIQFPWRFNAILCVAAAALAAIALALFKRPYGALNLVALVAASLLAMSFVAFTAHKAWRAYPSMQPVAPQEIFTKRYAQLRDAPEYRPMTAASTQEVAFEQLMGRICKSGEGIAQVCIVGGEGTISVERRQPRELALRVETAQGVIFHVSQFYYPGWAAYVDGRRHPLEPSRPDGLLHLTIPPGAHQVRLRLRHTAAEDRGIIVSSVSVILLLLCLIVQGKYLRGKKPARLPAPA